MSGTTAPGRTNRTSDRPRPAIRGAGARVTRYNEGMTPAPALCVYCRKNPAELQWHPFCSERCRLLDLARWVDGHYRVPGEPATSDLPDPDGHWPDETPPATPD